MPGTRWRPSRGVDSVPCFDARAEARANPAEFGERPALAGERRSLACDGNICCARRQKG